MARGESDLKNQVSSTYLYFTNTICKTLQTVDFSAQYTYMAQEIRAPAGPLITQSVPWEESMGTHTRSLGHLNWKQKSPWIQQT